MSYFNLYPSTIITEGVKKSCVVDVEKSLHFQLPNSIGHFLNLNRTFDIPDIKKTLTRSDFSILNNCISFLTNNSFAGLSEKPLYLTSHDITREFDVPFDFESIIIDANTDKDLTEFIQALPQSNQVKSVQLRLFFTPNYEYLIFLAEFFITNGFQNVELVMCFSHFVKEDELLFIVNTYTIAISRIIIMGCIEGKLLCHNKLVYSNEVLKGKCHCGKISKNLFMTDIGSITKSQKYNTCLFKKIAIDHDGKIKNCPSMSQNFGNIKDTRLEEAVAHHDYKKYWNITKDKIEVCKDCEYRHICTDCRAYLKQAQNMYSQPEKCTYNPYIAKWKGDQGYMPVEECGSYNAEGKFILNKKKVD